jgi:hypothetical protein
MAKRGAAASATDLREQARDASAEYHAVYAAIRNDTAWSVSGARTCAGFWQSGQ